MLQCQAVSRGGTVHVPGLPGAAASSLIPAPAHVYKNAQASRRVHLPSSCCRMTAATSSAMTPWKCRCSCPAAAGARAASLPGESATSRHYPGAGVRYAAEGSTSFVSLTPLMATRSALLLASRNPRVRSPLPAPIAGAAWEPGSSSDGGPGEASQAA